MAEESYRFVVSGRVQGVYFRQSTADQARALGLRGWVRNLPDGRVEGVAAGPAAALGQLQAWLRHGPSMARVDGLEWSSAGEQPAAGFEVRR